MKKMMVFVFFLLSLFSLFSSYLQKISEETEQFRRTINNNSQVVVFSESHQMEEDNQRKKEIVKKISEFSENYQLNIYKYDRQDQSDKAVFFSKINFNSKNIFQSLKMVPPPNKNQFTIENSGILSSTNKYILKDFNQLADSDILTGSYVIQYQQKKSVVFFKESLERELNFQIEMKEKNQEYSPNYAFQVIHILIILTLTLILLFFYYLNYKNNTVKSYFGYSDLQLVNDIYRDLFPAIFYLLGASLLFILFLLAQGVPVLLILTIVLNFWLKNIFFLSGSYVMIAVITKMSKKDWLSLKGRKPMKSALVIGIVFIYLIVPLITVGLSEVLPQTIETLRFIGNRKTIQQELKDYFYLPLLSAGVDPENEELLVPSFQNHTTLLAEFYKSGLLLFRPEESTKMRLSGGEYEKGYDSNEVWVSPAYLDNSDIKDLKGKNIRLTNDENKLIILVPEMLQKEIGKIKEYYVKSHDFYDYEVAQEFSKTSLKKETKEIKFIFIENNPKLRFYRNFKEGLNNPILRVLTPNNIQHESSVYADIILGQTDYFFVKNKENLKAVIKEKDVYSEFPVQISAYGNLMSIVNDEAQTIGILLTIVGTLILLYYLIAYFGCGVFLSLYSKKIKLFILFGLSLKQIGTVYLFIFLTPWLSFFFFNNMKNFFGLVSLIPIGGIFISFITVKKFNKNITDLE